MTAFDAEIRAEAEALRAAAERGDFAAAENAARRFTGLLHPLLAELPPKEAEARLLQACELIDWARRNLLAARSRIAGELRHLDRLRHYHSQLSPTVHTFRMDG